jgi:hypothetical protein
LNASKLRLLARLGETERLFWWRVTGSHARLNLAKLGYPVTAFLRVGLTSQVSDALRAFESLAAQSVLVTQCFTHSGGTPNG